MAALLCTRALGALVVGPGGLDNGGAEHGEPLSEDFLELVAGAPLHQHVPVGPRRPRGLLLRSLTVHAQRDLTAGTAVPGRRNLGIGRERDREVVPLGTDVRDLLAGRDVHAIVGLVARGPGAGHTTRALTDQPRRSRRV